MKKPKVQQKTERRISAALRLGLVAVLLLAQIALVLFLSDLLRQRMAMAYTVLELLALAYAFRINSRPGGSSYKLGWTLLILTVPVVGLILYWLWNGDHPQKRLDLKKLPRPQESEARREASRLQVEKLRREHPEWGRLAAYLDRQGFPLYTGTGAVYLPTGEAYLEDMLERMEQAEHFIFMEFYIMAEGQLWDRLMDIFRRKAGQGVEIKVLFDDFGSMMRMPEEAVEELRRIGAEVLIFNPVHHYVNRLYFNYRDHRKIACIDGDVRLMMPGIPDHKFAFMVAESYFGELLNHGVKIYRFTPGLLHGKTVLADREAAFVGSVNMDYRSFQLHFECGTLLYGAPAIETLLEDMDGIMEKSRQVTRADWEHRPLLHRVLGGLLRPFAMWM